MAAWEHAPRHNGIELQDANVSDKTEFDKLCEILNVKGVAALSPLRRFLWQGQQQQQTSILTHGLPNLELLSETTKFTSNPSIPAEEQHAAASLRISKFAILTNLGELASPKDNIWNRVTNRGHLGGYSNEAGVNKLVE